MRTAEQLLLDLSRLNVHVWDQEGDLRCSAPPGVLTADLRAELGERRSCSRVKERHA